MTQHTQHHEDLATITVHFHEDELLAYAAKLQAERSPSRFVVLDDERERLAYVVESRLAEAAEVAIHADRAKRRAPKA